MTHFDFGAPSNTEFPNVLLMMHTDTNIGSISVPDGGCPINPFSPFAWVQETFPGSFRTPTAHELPSIANFGTGRYEIPSIRQVFDFDFPSTSPR
jgi:hypothetical protein